MRREVGGKGGEGEGAKILEIRRGEEYELARATMLFGQVSELPLNIGVLGLAPSQAMIRAAVALLGRLGGARQLATHCGEGTGGIVMVCATDWAQ